MKNKIRNKSSIRIKLPEFFLKRSLNIFMFMLLSSFIFLSCDDKIVWEDSGEYPTDTKTSGMYILCEGLFNMNNSTISYYDFINGEMVSFQDPDKQGSDKTSFDFFKKQNKRRLGDTANDMKRYGSKIWCAVNVSSQIEVLDINSGKSFRQIPLFNESGIGRQPRRFAFYKDKAYVCNFDGTVMRIDTTTLAIEGYTTAGRNPDGICVANGKLYVSNSGGLDQNNPDNTVSVIDIKTFKEIKKITVRNNLGTILSDVSGNVYVTSREKFNYEINDYDCKLHRIDSETDQVVHTYDLPILSFTISGHKAYMYSYNTQQEAIMVLDTRTGEVTDYDFIKTPTQITRIYNITVNPVNDDVYICDAQNYVINGNIFCFSKEGQYKFKIDAKGINPNALVFTAAVFEDSPEDPGGNEEYNNYISQVFEYVPAAGQFVNQLPVYKEGDDAASMCAKCLENFNNNSLVSLGGFGGYITVGFEHPIANIPGEYDFRILGNAFEGSAEPGIVLVSKDTNGDGIPNDEWFELKGSEYNNAKTIHNYEIIYYKPLNASDKVQWTDNQGASGVIERTIHKQSYYPMWINSPTLTFRGQRLPDNTAYDTSLGKWVMSAYAYGYADNQPNDNDGCKFEIEKAIDSNGNPVELDKIDFIRVYTAVNQSIAAGGIGEVSTEIKGIEDLNFDK